MSFFENAPPELYNFKKYLSKPYLKNTQHSHCVNSTQYWSGMDEKSRFKSNLKNLRKKGINLNSNRGKALESLNYYIENPIEYKINNEGFRCDDFIKGSDVNIYMGCSITFGTGVHLNSRWANKLQDDINDGTRMVNLAQGGQGIENQFRHFYYWKDYFNIKNIFHYQPMYAREEFISNENTFPWSVQNKYNKFLIKYFGSYPNIVRKYVTNTLALQNLANQLDVPYYFVHTTDFYEKDKVPFARDLKHPSVYEHENIKNNFLKKYKNKDTYIDILDITYHPNNNKKLL